MTDVCVGVQWSQSIRREIWNDVNKHYNVVNVDIFKGDPWSIPWINFEDNINKFISKFGEGGKGLFQGGC
jgi:hypothetical protein